jgi:small subunit ribosomal protein S20
MANIKSAVKRIGTSEKRRQRNVAVKSAARTFVKKARMAIAADATEAQTDVQAAIIALDRAAKKGVIHRNNAARRKSRLMKRLNAAMPSSTSTPAAEAEPAAKKPAAKGAAKKPAAKGAAKKSAAKGAAKKPAAKTAAKPKTTRSRAKTPSSA